MIHEGRRNVVQVCDGVLRVAWHQTSAVDQNQCTGRTQAPQVDVGRAARAVRHRVILVGKRFRQVVDQRADVGRAFELEFLLADGGNGTGRVNAGLRNARTRDHHGLDIATALLGGSRNTNAEGSESRAPPKQTCAKAWRPMNPIWHSNPLQLAGSAPQCERFFDLRLRR